jgi:hypothetical protein
MFVTANSVLCTGKKKRSVMMDPITGAEEDVEMISPSKTE